MAALALQHHVGPPIMHIRSLNPYVASTFDEWGSMRHNTLPLVPREAAVLPAPAHCLAGTSAFGMSGVNAHALLATPYAGQGRDVAVLSWQRQRHWPMPVPHRMLMAALWDHSAIIARCGLFCVRCSSICLRTLLCPPLSATAVHIISPLFVLCTQVPMQPGGC